MNWVASRSRRTILLLTLFAIAPWIACGSTGRDLSKSERDAADALYEEALRYSANEELYSALVEVESSLRINPYRAEAHELLQDLMLKLEAAGDRPKGEALRIYEQHLEDHPDDPLFVCLFGRILYKSGQPDRGFIHFSRALSMDAQETCPNIRSALADYYRNYKKDKKMAREFESRAELTRARNRLRQDTEDNILDVAAHVRYQDVVFAGGDVAALEARYEALSEEYPEVAAFAYLNGRVLARAGRLEEARPFFERAHQLDPKLPWALDAKGTLVLKALESATFETPEDQEAAEKRAFEQAADLFRKAIAADPNFISGRKKLAEVLLVTAARFGDGDAFVACAQLLDESATLAPDHPEIHWIRGKMFLFCNAVFLATEEYRDALRTAALWETPLRQDAAKALAQIEGLTRLPPPDAYMVEEYLLRVESEDPKIRAAALAAFGHIRDRRAHLPISRAVEDPDATVRLTAIDVMDKLGMIFDESAVVLGRMLLSDPEFTVRGRAARMLGRFEQKWVAFYLIQGLADDDAFVREMSIEALRQVSGKDYPFDHKATPDERKAALVRWKDWWNKHAKAFTRQSPDPAVQEKP